MAATGDSSGSSVRKRHVEGRNPEPEREESGENHGEEPGEEPEKDRRPQSLHPGTFWLTRVVLLRSVAFIYLVAFSVAFNQNKQLIGERGLMPCSSYLSSVKRYVGGKIGMAAFAYTPSLLWLLDWSEMDANLDALAVAGMALSAVVLVTGTANMVIMASLWVLYHSLVSVGQLWYSFGWESQLLETGFLSIFLCPLWTLSQVPPRCPPLPHQHLDLQTQPVPNPISYYMHFSPWWFHRFEAISNHLIELVFPFFTFLGRRMCTVNGAVQVLFQAVLITSGNLSFLNWLTIVPSLACFDDAALGFLFSSKSGAKKAVLEIQKEEAAGRTPKTQQRARKSPRSEGGMFIRRAVNVSLAVLIGYLSVPVVMNLFSSKQVMNTSFDPLRIVNTYGAFGSITKERTEVIFQGTLSGDPKDPRRCGRSISSCVSLETFRGDPASSPVSLQADWLMWFAAFQTYEQSEWVIHIAGRLLSNDSSVLSLIDYNPFQGRETP
ncbi:hypothetical protein KUCAC02_029640, partial [Chaenocephalus aceratus]